MKRTIEQIIIELLQLTLKGKLKKDTNFNPQAVANAIVTKVDFGMSLNDVEYKRVIAQLYNKLLVYKSDMDEELRDVKPEEKILSNFVRGKITAYNEILDELKEF